MKKKSLPTTYNDIISALQELHLLYPTYTIGRHLSTALDEYGDLWGISDKEILFALTKYRASLEMDVPHETDQEEINRIIKDGMNLSSSSLLQDNEFDDQL